MFTYAFAEMCAITKLNWTTEFFLQKIGKATIHIFVTKALVWSKIADSFCVETRCSFDSFNKSVLLQTTQVVFDKCAVHLVRN